MLQSDSRRSDAGALCVGALPQVVAAADIVGRGGRRLAGLPAGKGRVDAESMQKSMQNRCKFDANLMQN